MIRPISIITPSTHFKNKNNPQTANSSAEMENPISRKGETFKLITATFVAGVGVAAKLLFELADNGDFLVEIFSEKAEKMARENNNMFDKEAIMKEAKKEVKNKKIINTVGAFAALVAAFFAGFALLYTAFHAPKIAYEGKINTFKKSKEMDVYIKSNVAEKELYTQLDEKAKKSTKEEKIQLKEQYLKLKNAKNEVPEFVNMKLK